VLQEEALAALVEEKYNVPGPVQCRLHLAGLNDTYDVVTPDRDYILRVYRHGWRSDGDVSFELDLLSHLKASGCPVAAGIALADGSTWFAVQAPEGRRQVALFDKAEGRALRNIEQTEATAQAYGVAAAQIHLRMDDFNSRHERFKLNLDHLLDEPIRRITPFILGRHDDLAHLLDLGSRLRRDVESRAPLLEDGLCHGDLHIGNAHYGPKGEITLFDFDCGGWGWRSYDLAVFRWAAAFGDTDSARCESAWDAFLRGYTSLRPIPKPDLEAVPLFVAIRQIWLIGLHAGMSSVSGRARLSTGYFDQQLGYLRRYEQEIPVW
jgi:Ser/Thr protein kinase RdoA (MazF antagonist)